MVLLVRGDAELLLEHPEEELPCLVLGATDGRLVDRPLRGGLLPSEPLGGVVAQERRDPLVNLDRAVDPRPVVLHPQTHVVGYLVDDRRLGPEHLDQDARRNTLAVEVVAEGLLRQSEVLGSALEGVERPVPVPGEGVLEPPVHRLLVQSLDCQPVVLDGVGREELREQVHRVRLVRGLDPVEPRRGDEGVVLVHLAGGALLDRVGLGVVHLHLVVRRDCQRATAPRSHREQVVGRPVTTDRLD